MILNGRVFSWLAWWRMIPSSSYCFCGTSERILLCHLRDVLISLSHTSTYVYMYVCLDTLWIINCVIVPLIGGIYLILKHVFRPLYMVEIRIGDALLVLLVMQGYHLSQTGFRSYWGILCLWTMGSHFLMIGAHRLIFCSKSIRVRLVSFSRSSFRFAVFSFNFQFPKFLRSFGGLVLTFFRNPKLRKHVWHHCFQTVSNISRQI